MKFNKLKTIVGILLMPLVFSLFIFDRIILTILFWSEVPSMKTWMVKDKLMMISFWRVLFVSLVYGFVQIIKLIF
jgi:hypothetical protein